MLHDQFHAAVAAARSPKALDEIARLCWRAHAEAQLSEIEAEAVAEAVQARRVHFITQQPRPAVAAPRPRPAPRSPDRQASLERRRRWVASGAMPPALAANFTMGEQAVLAVLSREVQKSGRCAFPIDQIAALAGVSRSTVKNAIREAKALGFIEVTERRRAGQPSLPNIVTVVSPSWRAWLRIGGRGAGVKNLTSSITRNLKNTENDVRPVENGDKLGPCRAVSGGTSHQAPYCSGAKAQDGANKWTITRAAMSA